MFESIIFKSFSRVKSIQDQKVHLIEENELKLTQVELLSCFYFKSVYLYHMEMLVETFNKVMINIHQN